MSRHQGKSQLHSAGLIQGVVLLDNELLPVPSELLNDWAFSRVNVIKTSIFALGGATQHVIRALFLQLSMRLPFFSYTPIELSPLIVAPHHVGSLRGPSLTLTPIGPEGGAVTSARRFLHRVLFCLRSQGGPWWPGSGVVVGKTGTTPWCHLKIKPYFSERLHGTCRMSPLAMSPNVL